MSYGKNTRLDVYNIVQKKNLFLAKITFSGLYVTKCQIVTDLAKFATFVQFQTHFNAYRLFLYTGAVLYRHLRRLSLGDYARYKRFVRIFGVVRVFYIRDLLNIRTELFMLPKYYFLLLWIKHCFNQFWAATFPCSAKGLSHFIALS